ncbi:hypothetical protein E2C01_007687 [Portunus trituberculatus]|uniref:Uncharacterized protein n=1 Tax=Portunus trituberculatus TaxID=210409 RepID=A0A5B7CZN1_PORTR|nr:hypothetical protein [Portunus trituberculatus]
MAANTYVAASGTDITLASPAPLLPSEVPTIAAIRDPSSSPSHTHTHTSVLSLTSAVDHQGKPTHSLTTSALTFFTRTLLSLDWWEEQAVAGRCDNKGSVPIVHRLHRCL